MYFREEKTNTTTRKHYLQEQHCRSILKTSNIVQIITVLWHTIVMLMFRHIKKTCIKAKKEKKNKKNQIKNKKQLERKQKNKNKTKLFRQQNAVLIVNFVQKSNRLIKWKEMKKTKQKTTLRTPDSYQGLFGLIKCGFCGRCNLKFGSTVNQNFPTWGWGAVREEKGTVSWHCH